MSIFNYGGVFRITILALLFAPGCIGVAHHVAVSHIIRERRTLSKLVSLEEIEVLPDKTDPQSAADRSVDLNRLSTLIQQLNFAHSF